MIHLLLAVLAAMPPVPASWVAAALLGRPDIAPALARVCRRESRCTAIGIHERDAWSSSQQWHGQLRLGHLDDRCQSRAQGWATRGAFGLSAASMWPFLPRCYDPAILDLPIVSALVAGQLYLDRCDRRERTRWCPPRSPLR